jgi:hypothetical protein
MLEKDAFYRERVWPGWLKELDASPKRVLLIHGIMGSELYDDPCDDTVWVDLWIWRRAAQLEVKALTPDGSLDLDGHMLFARSTASCANTPPALLTRLLGGSS